jgi:molecular chaperone GrpE
MGANRSSRPSPTDDERETAPEVDREVDHGARTDAELEAELSNVKDQLLRALAEQENFRRRAERDRVDAVKFAAADVVRDLLPSIDNLRRAIDILRQGKAPDAPIQNLLTGLEATERGLFEALEKHGIRRIDPLGERFDPTRHQAMLELSDPKRLPGTVAEVLQPGYLHHDRLLRPALVGVAKGDDSNPTTREFEA